MHNISTINKITGICIIFTYVILTHNFYNISTYVPQVEIPTVEPYNRINDLESRIDVFERNLSDCKIYLGASAQVVEELQTLGAWKNWDKARKKCDFHEKVLKKAKEEYEKEKNKN